MTKNTLLGLSLVIIIILGGTTYVENRKANQNKEALVASWELIDRFGKKIPGIQVYPGETGKTGCVMDLRYVNDFVIFCVNTQKARLTQDLTYWEGHDDPKEVEWELETSRWRYMGAQSSLIDRLLNMVRTLLN